MAIPSVEEMKLHLQAAMDPDYLRTMEHVISERLDSIETALPMQARPMVAVAGQDKSANREGPAAAARQKKIKDEVEK